MTNEKKKKQKLKKSLMQIEWEPRMMKDKLQMNLRIYDYFKDTMNV